MTQKNFQIPGAGRFILWMTTVLSILPLWAVSQDGVLQEIKRVSNNIQTIETDFIQTKHISFMEEVLVSKGKLFFKRSDKMRWEYTAPFRYVIVINGDAVSVMDGDKVKNYDAASNMLFGKIKEVIMNMVNGKMFDDPDYHTSLSEKDGLYMVRFNTVNPSMKDYILSIDLFFEKQSYQLKSIRMNEASGDFTEIEFVNHQLNKRLSGHPFTITP